MQLSSTTDYFRRDIRILAALVVVMALMVAVLWYAEQQSGWFSQTATSLLDSAAR